MAQQHTADMEARLHHGPPGPSPSSTYLLSRPSVGRKEAASPPSAVITSEHTERKPATAASPAMILRRIHLHACASRRSLAPAALCGTSPRALPSAGAGLLRRLHGAAGDGTSSDSEHGRKPGSHLTPPLASVTTIGLLVHGSGPFPC